MNQDHRRLEIGEDAAQTLALVRAVEESDRDGTVLPFARRREATVTARAETGDDWPARRAAALLPAVTERWGFVPRLLRLTHPGRGLAVPAVAAALLLGMATNALGPDRRIHVLALPLAGLLAWNVAVLLALAARRAWPIGGFAWRDSGRWLVRLTHHACRRWVDLLPAGGTAEPDLVRRVLAAYLRDWLAAVAPLSGARIRRLLHLASLAVLAGAVGGMYVRGLVFAYRATWESTFAGAETVERVLAILLGPASALTGIDIPAAEPIRAVDATSPGGGAAPWIHLWAVTAALFAGIPRAVLAAAEGLRVARLSRKLPVEVPGVYLQRLLASASTEVRRVDVVPYSYRLPAVLCDALRARLMDVYGGRADVRVSSPVEYGHGAEGVGASGHAAVVVFNLAQTPEAEVHGAFLSALAGEAGRDLYVLLDSSAFRERAPGETGETRLRARRSAWDRVVSAAGLDAIHLDLRRDAPEAVVGSLTARRDGDGP